MVSSEQFGAFGCGASSRAGYSRSKWIPQRELWVNEYPSSRLIVITPLSKLPGVNVFNRVNVKRGIMERSVYAEVDLAWIYKCLKEAIFVINYEIRAHVPIMLGPGIGQLADIDRRK